MHLEMQMRSHCAASMPHIGNDLPGFDLLAHRDTDAGAVRVQSSQPAAVVQLDVVTVTAAPTVQPVGNGHCAVGSHKTPRMAWRGIAATFVFGGFFPAAFFCFGIVFFSFVQLLKEIDSLRIDNEKSLQSYLYILTRERTIDFLRKWERRRGVLTDYENHSASFDNFKEPEEIALTDLQLNKAVSILSDMPSIYHRTLFLRVKGYSVREIAQITNSSESNVKTRIHRARAILLKSFDT